MIIIEEMTRGNFSFPILVVGIIQILVMIWTRRKDVTATTVPTGKMENVRQRRETMITLFDNWVVLVDAYNYTLAKDRGEYTDKDGVVRHKYDPVSYHRNLAGALKALGARLSHEQLQNGSHTLSEAVTIILESDRKTQEMYEELLAEMRLE